MSCPTVSPAAGVGVVILVWFLNGHFFVFN